MTATLRIDQNLIEELRAYAKQRGIALDQLINQCCRIGLDELKGRETLETQERYVEKTYNMGAPKIDLTNANHVAAQLEDEEIIRKMRLRKED